MSSIPPATLETLLNARADQEFRKLVDKLTGDFKWPSRTFGCGWDQYKRKDGNDASFDSLRYSLNEILASAFQEPFREKYRAEFVAKVEAMQVQMESYIGALSTDHQSQSE